MTANNKAEGSAPLSLLKLAEEIAKLVASARKKRTRSEVVEAKPLILLILDPGRDPLESRPLRTRVCGRRGDIPPPVPVSSKPQARGRCPRRPNRKRRKHGDAEFSMRQLLEAGVHFGHQTHRWNPKMEPYIFGVRNDIHIIDLTQTVPLLHQALHAGPRTSWPAAAACCSSAPSARRAEPVAEAAKRCAQYYVNHRWLGGTLTNWQTSRLDRAPARARRAR